MGFRYPEQRCPREKRGYSKFLKRLLRRLRRWLEKQRLEDAPKKNFYKGYSE